MKFWGIIPARYKSTRLPGKPLALIGGKPMVQRVYEQCLKSPILQGVYVATDDEQIYNTVIGFGGKAIMTNPNHPSGTDRCFEAVQQIGITGTADSVIINIQGDEPFIDPKQIELLAGCFANPGVDIATLVKKIKTQEELVSPNTAKVILDAKGNATYFSRSPLPYLRSIEQAEWLQHHTFYKHIGMYAYKYDTLKQIVGLPQSALEQAEMLEQLRWIENGYVINTALTETEAFAVDTAEDLENANKLV